MGDQGRYEKAQIELVATLTWAFCGGAGDGNRTRMTSLEDVETTTNGSGTRGDERPATA
ncbi:hypothetical protein GCM10023317_58840 [Actinopolymorpha pittospori]|uniref:Uncharacterized protein n=1 Tax=Actinopolymorpha pittospori TaxID=648752 RepID=A0A927MUL4_9ACTN|nr:hypothetical protein [Actinopolymorpha pittospori]